MTVSTTLQTMIGDISADIAGKKNWGRVELEKLRRSLCGLQREAQREEGAIVVHHMVTDELLAGVDRGIIDLGGLARKARERLAEVAR